MLAATSDYFRAMLQGPMRENKEACVDLKGLTSDALVQIVDFIYSGVMEFEFDNLMDILSAASHLQVHTALSLCSDYMIKLLTFTNADELLQIADTFSLQQVIDFYNNKVLSSFEDFSRTEQFLKLPANKLTRYLSDNALKVRSEGILFDMVARWFSNDQTRLESLDSVLKCVRFSLMTEIQLNQLRHHWFSTEYIPAINFISEGIKFHSDANVGIGWNPSNAQVRCKDSSLTFVHQGAAQRPFEITAYDREDKKFYHLVSDTSGSRDCRMVVVDNFIYISRVVDCGGGTLMNSLLRFDPRHCMLQELNPCRRLRIDTALAAKDNCLYLFGGTNEPYNVLDSVECYDIRANTWVDMLPLPSPLHSHAAVMCKGLIYISGGVSGQERQTQSSLYAYEPSTQHWESKSSMHCSRRLHEMAVIGERVFVLGGIGTHSYHQHTQIPMEVYDVAADQWSLLTATLAGRSVGHFVYYTGLLLSIGREHYDATEDDVWCYEIDTDTWKSFIKVPRRSGLATAYAVLLDINFFDERVSRCVITDRR